MNELKIENLKELNKLNEKALLLLNNNINTDFYDYYFQKNIDWLFENRDKIESDFNENITKLKFDIILNSNFIENEDLILSLKDESLEEFSKYIQIYEFNSLTKKEKKELEKQFEEFKNIDDKWLSICFFKKICRSKYK